MCARFGGGLARRLAPRTAVYGIWLALAQGTPASGQAIVRPFSRLLIRSGCRE
jgi:hypothetical protein